MFQEITLNPRHFLGAFVATVSGDDLIFVDFKGIGHNFPQEVPKAFADAIVEVDGY